MKITSPTINWKTIPNYDLKQGDHIVCDQIRSHRYSAALRADQRYLVIHSSHLGQKDRAYIGYFYDPDRLSGADLAASKTNYQRWLGVVLLISQLESWMQAVQRAIKFAYCQQSDPIAPLKIELVGDCKQISKILITIANQQYYLQINEVINEENGLLKIDEQMVFNWLHLQYYEQLIGKNPYDQSVINHRFQSELKWNEQIQKNPYRRR